MQLFIINNFRFRNKKKKRGKIYIVLKKHQIITNLMKYN